MYYCRDMWYRAANNYLLAKYINYAKSDTNFVRQHRNVVGQHIMLNFICDSLQHKNLFCLSEEKFGWI